MANILDYLDWRGDITFDQSPFNEVDNLILAELSFVPLRGIVPEHAAEGTISLHEAAERYFSTQWDEKVSLGLIVPSVIFTLFRKTSECRRYRDIALTAFVDHIDLDLQKQFAAITALIDDQQAYLSFRGTDDTLIGWKENFNMGVLEAVPSQKEAVAYVNEVAGAISHPTLYIGGHSKGGNLAIYAAIHADEQIKPRIAHVYSNDGPGYRSEVVASACYTEMQERIETIVPQSSVVGRLLEHDNRYRVVLSNASGLWQHDGFSWQVVGTHFVEAEALSKESEMIDRSLKKWIADMDDEKREKFIDSLYRVLTATNAKTLTELTKDRNWLWKMLRNSDSTSRKTVLESLAQLTGEAGRLWVESILPAWTKSKPAAEETVLEERNEKVEPVGKIATPAPAKKLPAKRKAEASMVSVKPKKSATRPANKSK